MGGAAETRQADQASEGRVRGQHEQEGRRTDSPEQCMVTSGKERVAPRAWATMATDARPQSQSCSCLMWGTGVETCMLSKCVGVCRAGGGVKEEDVGVLFCAVVDGKCASFTPGFGLKRLCQGE